MAAVFDSPFVGDERQDAPTDVWASIARCYAAFTSPLVPCGEDIDAFERAAASCTSPAIGRGLHALMLGITPGLALMQWPDNSRIVAVEQSPSVIQALWPGDLPGVRQAVCASWFALPGGEKCFDIALGDGSLNACRYPNELLQLVHCIADRLVDGGNLVVRSYVRPSVVETVREVFDALFHAGGMKVDLFKLRLWLALQHSAEEGVPVRHAATALRDHGVDPEVMRNVFGWSDAAVQPFSDWAKSLSVYTFPSFEQLCGLLGSRFEITSMTTADYEFGHCCPVLVARKSTAGRYSTGFRH